MTTAPLNIISPPLAPPKSKSALSLLFKRRVPAICLAIIAFYVLMALLTFVPAFDRAASRVLPPLPAAPGASMPVTEYNPPTFAHFPDYLLGTDIQNRSVFYRVLYGCRTALIITIFTSILSLGIGVTLGALAGYFGGWIDDAINWLVSTLSAVPWILLVLSLGFVVKDTDINFFGLFGHEADGSRSVIPIPDIAVVILAMGLTDWVGICRLIRGEVIKLRSLDYVSAAQAMGFSQKRVLFRHILPNTFHLVIITFTLGAIGYVQAEVALTFLGLGISEKPSWGRMIDDAKLELLRGVWWQFAAATIAIGILSLALSLLGDHLRDVLDPKSRSRN